MKSQLDQSLVRTRELHWLLNSRNVPNDLNAQYDAYFTERKTLFDQTSEILKGDSFNVTLHDAHVEGFSERRTARGWQSKFFCNGTAYGPDEYGQNREKGYCKLTFDIQSKRPLRAMSGKEIHTFMIDPSTKEVGLVYQQPGRNMCQVVAHYEELSVVAGPLRSLDEVLAERQASVSSAWARLTVGEGEGSEEHVAKWYVNGAIEVLDGDMLVPFSEFSVRFHEPPSSGETRFWISVGEGGRRSEIGGDLDEHGPSYANVQPLKTWLRAQNAAAITNTARPKSRP